MKDSKQQAEPGADERAAFEAWALKTSDGNCCEEDLQRWGQPDGDLAGQYVNGLVERDWLVWQARAAQSGQRAGVAIPDGWQVVPKIPTREMCQAAAGMYAIHATDDLHLHKAGWSMHAIMNGKRWVAMLAAAPTQQQERSE